MKSKRGNVAIIALIFVAIAIFIILFVMAIFTSHVNNVLYSFKLDMYSLNRSAIIAVNKNQASTDIFSYDENAYRNEFVNLIKSEYELDDDLCNDAKLISKIYIDEYEIYEKRKRDAYTGNTCDSRVIHTVIRVKIRPIILKDFLEDIFIFKIHEDVNLNMIGDVMSAKNTKW